MAARWGRIAAILIAPLGFALLLPLTCVPLAMLFGRAARAKADGGAERGMSGRTILG